MPQPHTPDNHGDGLPMPTSSLRKYRTRSKLGKQAESIPLMAVGSPATPPLIIWSYREIRCEKTTSHVPGPTAWKSADFLIRQTFLRKLKHEQTYLFIYCF